MPEAIARKKHSTLTTLMVMRTSIAVDDTSKEIAAQICRRRNLRQIARAKAFSSSVITRSAEEKYVSGTAGRDSDTLPQCNSRPV